MTHSQSDEFDNAEFVFCIGCVRTDAHGGFLRNRIAHSCSKRTLYRQESPTAFGAQCECQCRRISCVCACPLDGLSNMRQANRSQRAYCARYAFVLCVRSFVRVRCSFIDFYLEPRMNSLRRHARMRVCVPETQSSVCLFTQRDICLCAYRNL